MTLLLSNRETNLKEHHNSDDNLPVGESFELVHDYDLKSLLHTSELALSNNLDLPFACPSYLRIGHTENYLRVGTAKEVNFSGKTLELLDRAARVRSPFLSGCFREEVSFHLPLTESEERIGFKIVSESGRRRLHLTDGTHLGQRRFLEVWEQGSLICKVTVSSGRNRFLTEIKDGLSIAIHVEGQPSGMEILLSESEFTQRDWRNLFVFLLLSGDLTDAIGVLREKILPQCEKAWIFEKIEAFLIALTRNSKTTPAGLVPAPLTRGGHQSPQTESKQRFPTLWKGIEICWPESNKLDSATSEEIRLLKECLTEGRLPEGGEDRPKPEDSSETFKNAWGGLSGWLLIENRKYSEAEEVLSKLTPVERDPFGILSARALASHLAKMPDSSRPAPSIDSNDSIWTTCLSDMLQES
ncbi:MAG: hypothetical protein H6752_12295 [Candidatus Omnitrophica bacterium]|nr:hypothetical protein [Candidatus Omnitrophota bacterium]MCB9768966.1 hypothetical protein [Candidatus Omnitrophota bacterium]